MIKNLPIGLLFLIFLIFNIIDIVTSFFILPGETNVIFILTNNIYLLTIFKILIVCGAFWIYYKNEYPTHFSRFMFISILVLANLGLILACYGNIQGILNPEVVQLGAELSQGQKTQAYFSLMTFIYVLPLLFSLLSFKIYEWSLK